MRYLLLGLLLVTSPCFADDVIRYDPVTNVVTSYERSVNQPTAGPGVLVWTAANDTMTVDQKLMMDTLVQAIQLLRTNLTPPRYWKIVSGAPVEMTQAEKDAVDAPTPQQVQTQANLAELATLLSAIDVTDTDYTNLTTAQKLALINKVRRVLVLRAKLGG